MDNSNMMQTQNNNMARFSDNTLEELYPDTYRTVYPYVERMISDLIARGVIGFSNENLDNMSDEIIRQSGIPVEDTPAQNEAVTTINGFGQGQRGRGHRRHNRSSLRELIRILLLREIFGKRGHDRNRGGFGGFNPNMMY